MGARRAPLDYVNRGALRACLYKAARYARTSVLSQVSVALRARAPTHTVRSHSLTHKQATSRATYRYLRTVRSSAPYIFSLRQRYATASTTLLAQPWVRKHPHWQTFHVASTLCLQIRFLGRPSPQGGRVAPTSCPRRARSAPHMAILRVAHVRTHDVGTTWALRAPC